MHSVLAESLWPGNAERGSTCLDNARDLCDVQPGGCCRAPSALLPHLFPDASHLGVIIVACHKGTWQHCRGMRCKGVGCAPDELPQQQA